MIEALNNIGFDWQIAFANFIGFLLIFWILKKFAFGPIKKLIAERQETIQTGIDQAQQSENELLVAQQKAEEEIKAAKGQANQIVADAKEQADTQISNAKGLADNEVAGILKKANAQIEKNKVQMEKELLEKTAGLVAMGVEKILEQDVDQDRNSSLNKRALDILKQN
ncbi:MAG: F-type H+-transporting ATPase subunit b [Porticoccaceae bacterium]|jgi:F-type H+-transporting ATPase subunit b